MQNTATKNATTIDQKSPFLLMWTHHVFLGTYEISVVAQKVIEDNSYHPLLMQKSTNQ